MTETDPPSPTAGADAAPDSGSGSPQGHAVPQPNSQNRKITGSLGESAATKFLEAHGYRIVDANVRPIGGARRGEIDLVAWDAEYLVFIEVKTRRGSRSRPAEAVDWRKRVQLVKLARAYIARYNLDDVPCRFDVVEVLRIGETLELNLLVNAFDGSDV